MKQVSVSILNNNDKYKNIEIVNNSNANYIHLDIMDGKFVDNKFIIIEELPKVLELCKKKIDIHFMVEDPLKYLDICKNYEIEYITIHYEINNFSDVLNYIKNMGVKVGVSIKPETDINELDNYLDKIDLVLVMGVNPGYSGQTFIDNTENKINKLKTLIKNKNLNVKISVDGGVNDHVLNKIKNADIVVSASYVLNNLENIDKIKAV